MPVHPDCDGLCYAHGTFARRASRQDNFLREVGPLSTGSATPSQSRQAFRAMSRAVAERRISPAQAAQLANISNLLRQAQRLSYEDAFCTGNGLAFDNLRKFLDQPRSSSEPQSGGEP